jgi:hypothetical protein
LTKKLYECGFPALSRLSEQIHTERYCHEM